MRLSIAFLVCALLLPGSLARANVIEITDEGHVRLRRNTAAVQWVEPGETSAPGPSASIAAGKPARRLPMAAITPDSAAPIPAAWRPAVEAAAAHARLSPHLLAALVWQESRWHAGALSPKGAMGLTQLMPATARALAVDPHDPVANLEGGARYLRLLLDMFDGDIERSLAAYNAGAARVIRAGGVPRIAETRAYVTGILARMTPNTDTGFPQ